MNIWILDDLHGKEIYEVLKIKLPEYTYPVKKDVKDPLPYLEKMKDGDIILLDNYFDGWKGALGDVFLEEYLILGMKCDIIAISDFGRKLTKMFENWKKVDEKGDVIGWIGTKKGEDIAEFIKTYYK